MNDNFLLRLSFVSKYKFPKKLMKVANDGILIKWTEDNDGLLVHKKEYEDNVMKMYPGFVQVGAFNNLRRLFRDYNFDFRIVQNKYSNRGLQVEFRHPNFTKDNFHSLSQVKKRPRKSSYNYYKHKRQLGLSLRTKSSSSTKYRRKLHNVQSQGKRSYGSARFDDDDTPIWDLPIKTNNFVFNHETPTKQMCSPPLMQGGIYELFSGAEMSPIIKPRKNRKLSSRLKPEKDIAIVDCKRQEVNEIEPQPGLWDKDRLKLMQLCAKNELTEDEFWEWATKDSNLSCQEMSWEMIKEHIDKVVCQELSPLHFKGYYYELSLSEL